MTNNDSMSRAEQLREKFRSEACEVIPTLREDSGQAEWSQGELDCLFDRIKPIITKALEEKETIINAWHSVFGTTQLSHAQARLESAEAKVAMQDAEIAKLKGEVEKLTEHVASNLCGYCEEKVNVVGPELNSLRKQLEEKDRRLQEISNVAKSASQANEQYMYQLAKRDAEIAQLKKELSELRSYCTLTFGESHPEIRKCPHELENDSLHSLLKDARRLLQDCKGVLESFANEWYLLTEGNRIEPDLENEPEAIPFKVEIKSQLLQQASGLFSKLNSHKESNHE